MIVDDIDAIQAAGGANLTGIWLPLTVIPPGSYGSLYFRSDGLLPGAFSWDVPVLSPGRYRVYTRWVSDPAFAPDATYSITHTTGTASVSVDQRTNGGSWYLLGTYDFNTNALVSLNAQASGTVIADAVRLVPATAIDPATWNPPEAVTYAVYARWPESTSHSQWAMYTVSHSTGTTELVRNQQTGGNQWNLLGTYTFGSTAQGISLSADPDSTVAADAIRFVPTNGSQTQETTAYIHADQLNTPQRMTDPTQAVVWDASYKPFGEAAITKQPYYDNPLRFPGQYFDAETGLYQNHHRNYDPGIGRYLQSDPTGLDDGPNVYTYVGNNPISWFDFDGEKRRRCPGRVFEILRQAVIVACKDTNTRCEDDDSCDEIKFKTTVKRLCIQAQEALTKWCYPDDPSHNKRIDDTKRGIKRCQDVARRKNCECEAPSNGD